MTEKELKKLKREDYIELIYQYQRREQQLLAENARLREKLAEKYTGIQNAGSIAQAALAVNHVMEAAQKAADQYLEEIRRLRDQAVRECGSARPPEPRPEYPEADLSDLLPENWNPELTVPFEGDGLPMPPSGEGIPGFDPKQPAQEPEPLPETAAPADPAPQARESQPEKNRPAYTPVRLDSRWLETAPQSSGKPPVRPAGRPRPEPEGDQERADFEALIRSYDRR